MKVHRYSEQQRRQWVYEMQKKVKTVKQLCNEAAVSRATLYNWMKEFEETTAGGINEIHTESTVAWQPLDKHKMLLSALHKIDRDKAVSRKLVSELVKRYTLTISQACVIAGIKEEQYGYRPRKPEVEDRLVYDELLRLIAEDTLRGLDDCQTILQCTHPEWTRKQVKRIYRQGRLYLKRTRVRSTRLLNIITPQATVYKNADCRMKREDAFWQAGLIEGKLNSNSPYWLLYIIDYHDGTPLNAVTGAGTVTAGDLIRLLSVTLEQNGAPKKMRVIAQPPFNNREVTRWVWDNKVALYNLSLAKPENQLEIGYLEDSIKQQLLDENRSVDDLKEKTAQWIAGFAEKEETAEVI